VIETLRPLLLNRRAHPNELGHDRDLVGRFFAERMSARTGYPVRVCPELIGRTGLYSVHEAAFGVRVQEVLWGRDAAQRERQLVNCAFFPPARYRRPLPAGMVGHLRNVATGLGDLGVVARDRLRWPADAGGVLALHAQGEQAPSPEALRGAGLGHVELMLGDERRPALRKGAFHHLGATRMHSDPAVGVADADCRVHGVGHLYVAGSSVFPTYGCSNATLAVMALALRLADRLKKQVTG
jgi:hypothetical protein